MTESEKGELHTFEVKTGDSTDYVQATNYELNAFGQLIFRNEENKIARVYNTGHWKSVKDWHEDDDDDG